MSLNQLALAVCRPLLENPTRYRAGVVTETTSGVRMIDCGVSHRGGLEAGLLLAETCLAGLGRVSLGPGDPQLGTGPSVSTYTDHPTAACLASQYAGWPISHAEEKYFAMGSGPMRAARGKEKLFDHIGHLERPDVAVGILESSKLPGSGALRQIAGECGVEPAHLTLLVAPTASLAGTLQVVARTVETALHKLHEIGFPLDQVISGFGVAPLPPIAKGDLAAIGRTNDAILYGGEVTLWVAGEDALIETLGPKTPSSASADFGQTFAALFRKYNHDFYQMDPMLFSPAVVNFVNMRTGRSYRYGQFRADILQQSFSSAE